MSSIRRDSWWQKLYVPYLCLFYVTFYSPCWWGVLVGNTDGRYLTVIWVFAVPVTLGLFAASSFSFDTEGPEPIGWQPDWKNWKPMSSNPQSADRKPIPTHVWQQATRHLGRRVLLFDCIESTNSAALSLGIDPANHGIVILADEQTAGRGQYGRSWQAPPGSSVLMSLLLFPPAPLRRPAVLTAWAAVAVAQLICQITRLEAKIKWPNDVYLQDRKICGILIEQRSGSQAEQAPATVVGIGLNVKQADEYFEQAGLTLGGSLLSLSGKTFDHHDVARRLIHQLDADYSRLVEGNVAILEANWRARLGLIGQPVRVEALDGFHEGRLNNLTLHAVELDIGAETPLRLLPEAVRHIRRV